MPSLTKQPKCRYNFIAFTWRFGQNCAGKIFAKTIKNTWVNESVLTSGWPWKNHLQCQESVRAHSEQLRCRIQWRHFCVHQSHCIWRWQWPWLAGSVEKITQYITHENKIALYISSRHLWSSTDHLHLENCITKGDRT